MRLSFPVPFLTFGLLCAACDRYGATDRGDGHTNLRVMADLKTLEGTLKVFNDRTGRLPTTKEGLRPLLEQKLLPQIPVDPWGSAYHYEVSANERGYDLYSLGMDREPSADDIHLK